MKISFKERNELKSMMINYRNIHEELSFYEGELNKMSEGVTEKSEERIMNLSSKIKSCVNSLQFQRTEEKKMYARLEKKYGPGKLDVLTFEYKEQL